MEFAVYAINNFNGKLLDEADPSYDYITYSLIDNPPGNFKNYKINDSLKKYRELLGDQNHFERIFIQGDSMNDLISNGEKLDLRYIISNDNVGYFHPFVDDVYKNENKYPYLMKVFDSDQYGFKKLKLKVFEIDYEKFHQFEG